jgi:hypothetical protein
LKHAKGFQDSQRTDQRRGVWRDPRIADLTVDEVAELWLACNPANRPGTHARDETIWRVHIQPAIGTRPIGSITQPDAQEATVLFAPADSGALWPLLSPRASFPKRRKSNMMGGG